MAKTLLLADDSVTIQKVVSISFASEDVTLVTVDNGDDAIERAKEVRPDLILADVVMPGKSGYEVCEAVKADPDLRHIPVLLLSGTFEAFDEERAARAGAAGHVAKPFEAQSLVDQVNRLLSEPSPAPVQTTPSAPEEAVAAPVDSSPADSFDFFDDDLAELDVAISEPAHESSSLELPDDVFGMPDADLTPVSAAPIPDAESGIVGSGEAYPDRTLAIMPDENEPSQSAGVPPTAVSGAMLSDEPEPGFGELIAMVEEESDDSFVTADPASTSDEAFDFSFETESTAPESIEVLEIDREGIEVAVDELVEGTIRDPIEGVGFDVDPMSVDEDDMGAEEEPPVVAPVFGIEDLSNATQMLDASTGYEEEFAPAELEMAPELAEEAPIVPELAESIEPPSSSRSIPLGDDDSAARAEAVLAEISPGLREALHDTLEKIAWEAFGEVTDKIVREVVDRVEKVAWEVVPQLTETLIKAEIQRLKGDD